MLKLKQITKDYGVGGSQVHALRGLDICFRPCAISMVLTFIAVLIPSRLAAKKDPVEALWTE